MRSQVRENWAQGDKFLPTSRPDQSPCTQVECVTVLKILCVQIQYFPESSFTLYIEQLEPWRVFIITAYAALYKSASLQLCPVEFSVAFLSMASVLERVAISFSGGLPDPGIEPKSPASQADSSLLSHQGSTVPCSLTYKYTSFNLFLFSDWSLEVLTALNSCIENIQTLSPSYTPEYLTEKQVWFFFKPGRFKQLVLQCNGNKLVK